MCGIIGVVSKGNTKPRALDIVLQANAYQTHRGQDAFGFGTVFQGRRSYYAYTVKCAGLATDPPINDLSEEFDDTPIMIAHTRYPTAGANDIESAQPHQVNIEAKGRKVSLTLCSNGDLVPSTFVSMLNHLTEQGYEIQSRNDAELIAYFIADKILNGDDPISAIRSFMDVAYGSYSSVMIYQDKMYVFRDPRGMRPLVMGRNDNYILIASETCTLNYLACRDIRHIIPGEIVVIDKNLLELSTLPEVAMKHAHCIFELIYFSRPDSTVFGIPVATFRKLLGYQLYEMLDESIDLKTIDLVSPVPDSSNFIAIGFAQASGIPFDIGFIRSHYALRTFIADDGDRANMLDTKLAPTPDVVKDKNIVVVDDSIVRGSTTMKNIAALREFGTREIHMAIGSPPIKFGCYYGIDTSRRKQLIASAHSVDEISHIIDADSLTYLTTDSLGNCLRKCGKDPSHYCMACFTGAYPTPL